MASTFKLTIDQGTTLRFSVTVMRDTGDIDPDGQPVREPYDFTGCTARMQIRERPGTTILAEASTEDGGITFDATAGKIDIHLTDDQTDAITATVARYDVEVTYPSGDVLRVLQGPVTCSPSITEG